MKVAVLAAALVLLYPVPADAKKGPVDQRNSALTQGNVQLNLRVGVTTKADVLDTFGSPNITTRDGAGQEVWSYQRMATVLQSSSSSSFWTILLAGQASTRRDFHRRRGR